ncbi:MAG: VWA domain-containing protein [Bacteroidales bacterium]|nr:VWA domain-containing protein [Bacteroidales bacterium]
MGTRFFKNGLVFTGLLNMLCFWINAQPASMKLATSLVDFGNIASVMYPAKTVEFTNVSDQKLAILVVEKGRDVKVGYERRFFGPGEKGLISVFYQPGYLGTFTEEIRIYTNLDNDPYVLTLKGNAITIEECFPDRNNMTLRNVLVVNKETQAPLPFVEVSFVHNFKTENPILCKTDGNGKAVKALPIGQYNVKSALTGYEPYNLDFFLPRSQPNVLIELIPLKAGPVMAGVESPVFVPATKDTAFPAPPVVTSTELPEDKYAANNIVLLLDVSSSMRQNGKFTLLQQSVNNLALALRHIDNVSIITYAGDAKIVLRGVPGDEKDKIMEVVQELTAAGITQGVKGLNTAYELATRKFIENGNNQIILATDGEFSEKNVTDTQYEQLISGYADKGIKLSILGFGINEEAISRMKKMAGYGQGSYLHIGSAQYVKDVLINEVKAMSFVGGR